jgi:hypothetical protein
MRFLAIYKTEERNAPPSPEMMAAMGALIDEMTRAGVLITTEGCLPSAMGARVRRAGAKVSVSDGPFTESKELIGGFAMLNVSSKEEAIAWTKRFLAVAGDGEAEIRQINDGQGPEAPCVPAAAETANAKA